MLTAPNLHQFAHEDKARRARHAEIDVRYAWLARQSGAWPAGESRKYPRGSPQLLCRIRLRELEALYGARYGGTLPYDDAGIDDLKIAAHHIGHMGGDAIGHIVAWADMWMPDLPRERAKAIARDIVDDPVKFKAATLAWRLRLTEQERTTLGIKNHPPLRRVRCRHEGPSHGQAAGTGAGTTAAAKQAEEGAAEGDPPMAGPRH